MSESIDYRLRPATSADEHALTDLIARSARALCANDYSPEQIEGALAGAFGVDSELIRDGTYFAVEHQGVLVGCGGWSRRATLFGGDRALERDSRLLDPATEPAKIRAFFVDPDHVRRGIGRLLLEACEQAARSRGFVRFELMATLAGVRLYRALGYVAGAPVQHELSPSLTIQFVPMHKG